MNRILYIWFVLSFLMGSFAFGQQEEWDQALSFSSEGRHSAALSQLNKIQLKFPDKLNDGFWNFYLNESLQGYNQKNAVIDDDMKLEFCEGILISLNHLDISLFSDDRKKDLKITRENMITELYNLSVLNFNKKEIQVSWECYLKWKKFTNNFKSELAEKLLVGIILQIENSDNVEFEGLNLAESIFEELEWLGSVHFVNEKRAKIYYLYGVSLIQSLDTETDLFVINQIQDEAVVWFENGLELAREIYRSNPKNSEISELVYVLRQSLNMD